jgi:transposase
MQYEYAYSAPGEVIYGEKQGSRRGRTSIIGAYGGKGLEAVVTFEGSCNRSVVETWLAEQLLPQCEKGTVIVMDNASFHKGGRIRELIEQKECHLLYLPPYSPDMNPIEKCWGWLKRKIRRARKEHDSMRETVDAVISTLS